MNLLVRQGCVEDQILLGRILWISDAKTKRKLSGSSASGSTGRSGRDSQQMIDVYRDAGESAEEQRWLARGCELDCPVSLRLRYARILAAGQELEVAIEQFRVCIEREESRSVRNEIRQELAALLDRSGIAEDELSKLLARTDSENDLNWLEIAALQLQKEQFSGVVDAAERAVSGAGAASGAGHWQTNWLFVADALVARQQQASASVCCESGIEVSNNVRPFTTRRIAFRAAGVC